MRDRLKMAGGNFKFESNPKTGTMITALVPVGNIQRAQIVEATTTSPSP
jgi:signal transduction histidine kinase